MRNRSSFAVGMTGVLAGALLMIAAPATAKVGDALILGNANKSGAKTTFVEADVSNGPAFKITNPAGGGNAALRVDSAGPPFATNSSKKVKNFNSDKVDGLHAEDLRLIVAEDNENLNADNDGLLVTLDVPVAGHLLVDVSVDIGAGVDPDSEIRCTIGHGSSEITLTDVPNTAMTVSTSDANEEAVCSTIATIPVSAGHQVVAVDLVSNDPSTDLYDGQLRAVFVPGG